MVVNQDARCLGLGSPMKGTGGWKEHIANRNGTSKPEENRNLPLWPVYTRECDSLEESIWRGSSGHKARLVKLV